MITLADIKAAVDVVKQATEESDQLDAAHAILLRDEMQNLLRATGEAISFLNSRALNALERQPITIGETVYVPRDTGKWRPNQSKIRVLVVERAIHDFETGERISDARQAAAQAVAVMTDLFVAPKQMPKQGGLDKLGMDYSDVADWEITGQKLKEIHLAEAPE